jgi:hypothetical protein
VKPRKGLDVSVRKVKIDESRTYGVEFEFAAPCDMDEMAEELSYAGVTCYSEDYNHDTVSYWKIVEDGSVYEDWQHDNDYPMELVSPPLRGRAGLAEVARVLAVLNRLGCSVNRSCGLHVHHDARDLDLTSMKVLTKAYIKLEDVLDSLVAEDRRGDCHTYCSGLRWSGASVSELFARVDAAYDVRSLYRIWDTRFVKLNLDALRVHGTVEFRQHEGTLDEADVLAWISMTQGLVMRAKAQRKVTLRVPQRPFESLVWISGMNACVERHLRAKYRAA